MEELQKTLLSEMLEESETKLGSTNKGIYEIKRKLFRKKVLLVLDDVDDKEELENLAGGCDWFGAGSRIIITTREKDVLIAHHVGNIYEMKELDEQHSLELFCWNAFGQGCPKTGFQDVSMRAVDYAKGLALALKVIGSDLATLHEESLDAWEDALEEYEKTPPNKKIQDVLKISYDRLDDDVKQVFLDIACFFKGERMKYVKKILKEFCSTSNMKVLVNKSLITVKNDRLKMHDLIQDMGRQIVRQEAPDNPGERSRIWDYEDVIEILTEDLGSDKIQGIKLDPPKQAEVIWSRTEFGKMKWLRILIVRNTSFSSELQHLPNHLRLLDWDNYPSKSFPQKFHPKKIVVFNLPRSCLTFKEPFKKFSCLSNMDFSYNQRIIEIPDVSELQNLRELRLDHCRNLIAVHQSVGFLKWLSHLSVSECTKLQNFLSRMFLPSLEVFDLNLCERISHFPEIMQETTKPLKIYMINTGIHELPESIGKLIGLVFIDISNNRQLKYLPSNLFMLPNVDSFKIKACSKLGESFRSLVPHPSKVNVRSKLRSLNFQKGNLSDEDLLAIICYFPKLEELIVSENNFVSIPSCINECGDLTSLDLNGCKKLKKIPEFTGLRILDVHHCFYLEEISELPSIVRKVDARFCLKLTKETSHMLWCEVSYLF
ncbi:disease resistance protein Roq1-like [Vigna angularis]|uniref:disease resistance protein Roq1-like n=1 Tax=Phaseolus angularis TaxID=3914 RepID=UPI0022B435FC|nr:disease resistance protein Roq1-like [Vigna angularis]